MAVTATMHSGSCPNKAEQQKSIELLYNIGPVLPRHYGHAEWGAVWLLATCSLGGAKAQTVARARQDSKVTLSFRLQRTLTVMSSSPLAAVDTAPAVKARLQTRALGFLAPYRDGPRRKQLAACLASMT